MQISTPTQGLDVKRVAREALDKMKASATPAEAIAIGDQYLKTIGDNAADKKVATVAATVAHVSGCLRSAESLKDSARAVSETGLSALAAGVSGPLGKTLATLGLNTAAEIRDNTFWGKSGEDAGQGTVVGWYLRAIEKESSKPQERLLATAVFAAQQHKARCFDSTSFDIAALELVRDGHADAGHTQALLTDIDSKFRQWPGGGD